jgi:Lipocalin-like domain
MTKFSIRYAALFLFSFVILSGIGACKKDSAADKSRTELITQAAWKLVKSESKTGTGAWVDGTGLFLACEKDDNFVFRTNASYEINEGLTKCAPTDPQIYETGTWAFQTNETEVRLTSTGSSSSDISVIEQLTETTLVITQTYVSGGTTYYDRTTLGH